MSELRVRPEAMEFPIILCVVTETDRETETERVRGTEGERERGRER